MGQHQPAQPEAGLTWVFGHLSFWCSPQTPSSRTRPGAPTRRAESPGTPCPSCGSTGSACSPWTSLSRARVWAGAGAAGKAGRTNSTSEQGPARTSARWEASPPVQSPSQAACLALSSTTGKGYRGRASSCINHLALRPLWRAQEEKNTELCHHALPKAQKAAQSQLTREVSTQPGLGFPSLRNNPFPPLAGRKYLSWDSERQLPPRICSPERNTQTHPRRDP